jgi:competence protein ComGF
MNKMVNIPAFTIIEAVVSMAVTAIILAIIFVIFSITSERLYDFKIQNETIADLNRMNYTLNKSIFDGNKMSVSDNELIIDTYDGNQVKYTIYPDYFIRNGNKIIDTFKINVFKFKIDTLYNKSKTNIYQRLQCSIEINEHAESLNFYKKLYVNELLKAENHEF